MNKVILVDDHYIVRQGLRFLLSTIENIEVLQDFADGETFLEYLKEHEHPDIVLLDLVMPGMNGIEITEYIKAHYPDIKVLVLTSYVDDEHVISAINKGADGYEMKDVEPQQLIETIRRVMNGYILRHKMYSKQLAKNHTTRISCQREKLKCYVKWLKVKQIKRLQKLYLYLKKQLKHMSVIYLVNYKLAIVHKQQFMQWKIS